VSRDGTALAVDAVKPDDLIPDKGALKPSLIKVDLQGAEMLVLQSASDTLRIAGPALFVELHEEGLSKFGTSVSAILDYLSQYGYQGLLVGASGQSRQGQPDGDPCKRRP
jgi:hypothetical protein